MSKKLKKPIKAEVKVKYYCSGCEEEIYACDACKDYFWEAEEVYCNRKTGEHFCGSCEDARIRSEVSPQEV